MKFSLYCVLCFVVFQPASVQQSKLFETGMNKIKLLFSLDEKGSPVYQVYFNQKPVILPSKLGFALSDKSRLYEGFKVIGTEKKSFDETWQPVWGETKNIRNNYNQLIIHLYQIKSPNRLLNIIFRVFEDGVGFRYEFPKQVNLKYFIVTDELTQFHLAGDHKTFWIPGDYDSNEYPYTTSKLSEIDNKELVEKSTAIAVRDATDRYAVQTP